MPLTPAATLGIARWAVWHSLYRPHQALDGRTPKEAWRGVELTEPIPILARDDLEVQIDVRRESFQGDRRQSIINIRWQAQQRRAA